MTNELWAAGTIPWITAPKTVDVPYGAEVEIKVSFYYKGPDFKNGYLYAAIGYQAPGIPHPSFEEQSHSSKGLTILKTSGRTVTDSIRVKASGGIIAAGTKCHIYFKIMDSGYHDKAYSDYYEDAIHIVGIEPEFTNLTIVDWGPVE